MTGDDFDVFLGLSVIESSFDDMFAGLEKNGVGGGKRAHDDAVDEQRSAIFRLDIQDGHGAQSLLQQVFDDGSTALGTLFVHFVDLFREHVGGSGVDTEIHETAGRPHDDDGFGVLIGMQRNFAFIPFVLFWGGFSGFGHTGQTEPHHTCNESSFRSSHGDLIGADVYRRCAAPLCTLRARTNAGKKHYVFRSGAKVCRRRARARCPKRVIGNA